MNVILRVGLTTRNTDRSVGTAINTENLPHEFNVSTVKHDELSKSKDPMVPISQYSVWYAWLSA